MSSYTKWLRFILYSNQLIVNKYLVLVSIQGVGFGLVTGLSLHYEKMAIKTNCSVISFIIFCPYFFYDSFIILCIEWNITSSAISKVFNTINIYFNNPHSNIARNEKLPFCIPNCFYMYPRV